MCHRISNFFLPMVIKPTTITQPTPELLSQNQHYLQTIALEAGMICASHKQTLLHYSAPTVLLDPKEIGTTQNRLVSAMQKLEHVLSESFIELVETGKSVHY